MAKKAWIERNKKKAAVVKKYAEKRAEPVSYTHLTLPTIYSV